MAWRFWSDHDDVDILGGFDLSEMHVKTVSKCDRRAAFKVRLNLSLENFGLKLVGG